MYSTLAISFIITVLLISSLFYGSQYISWDNIISENIGDSQTESIKQELWIDEFTSVESYFENRERTWAVRNTEGEDLPEMVVNEEIIDAMPTVEKETDKNEAEEIVKKNNGKIPDEVNLQVPFYAQAPDADWSLPWKEACEEASIALAYHFVMWDTLSKSQFKEDVLDLTSLVEQKYGAGRVDTNVDETAEILEEYYDYTDYTIIDNPTVEDLKKELAQGHPIVAPFAGKELWNSFFTNGGPRYHMLVIVWYNEEFFLTNDVGTSRGENFAYSYDTIINALHDFVPIKEGEITNWAKKVLVLR